MRHFIVVATCIIAVFAGAVIGPRVTPLAAQGDKPKCDAAGVIKEAAALTSTGDDKKDLAALIKLRDDISQVDVTCNGWMWKGDKTTKKIIGPIQFPDGTYKFTITTKDFVTLDIKNIDETKCDVDSIFVANVAQGEADTGADHLVSFKGSCKIYLEPSTADGPWTLTAEPIS